MIKILHDNGKPIKLLGNTVTHTSVLPGMGDRAEIVTWENALDQSQQWVDDHQFFCSSASPVFRIPFIKSFQQKFKGIDWISVVRDSATVYGTLGKNCWVSSYVIIDPGSEVGDHCTIGSFCELAHHENVLEDFVHLSPRISITKCHLKEGTWVGYNTWMHSCVIEPYSAIMMNSRIKHATLQTGTYSSGRRVSARTSMQFSKHVK